MPDPFSRKKRSWVMSRIRSKNTKPELIVRSMLHRCGFRYSLRRKPPFRGAKDDYAQRRKHTCPTING